MTNPILFTLPGSEEFCAPLCRQLNAIIPCDTGELQIHYYPDAECSPRLMTPVTGRNIIFGMMLDRPDFKIMPVYLAASIARELGARSVGFVAPYLPYMRHDADCRGSCKSGGRHFARLLSGCCDWLVTAEPCLGQRRSLSELYTVTTRAVDAGPAIANWIAANVASPVIFALNAENEKWAAGISEAADCPYAVLEKTDHDDQDAEVSIPDAKFWAGMTPVLIADIVSSARIMIAASRQIELAGMVPPVCIAVHPLFTGDAYDELRSSRVDRIVSCNTVSHASNRIDLCQPIALAVADCIAKINGT